MLLIDLDEFRRPNPCSYTQDIFREYLVIISKSYYP